MLVNNGDVPFKDAESSLKHIVSKFLIYDKKTE